MESMVPINVDARDIQYIYSENNDAGIFSPERAEKQFYQILLLVLLLMRLWLEIRFLLLTKMGMMIG